MIGHINLNAKRTGEPTALNLHGGFEEAGTGTIRKTNLLRNAPVLDPTHTSFLHFVVSYITNTQISFVANYIVKLTEALQHNNLPLFFQTLEIFFANIPYTMQLPLEKYYQSIFYVIMSLIGTYIHAEVVTNEGRIDATIETTDYIYLFEFKLKESAEEAIQQIIEKKYYQKYLATNKKIVLIGVKFDLVKCNIEQWVVKEYPNL